MIRFPPKSILVPYDFSRLSNDAWRLAARLAERFGAAVEVVYVEPWMTGVELVPPLSVMRPSHFRPVRARIREAVGPGPKITVAFGEPAERILHVAHERRPDLVVMGSHGRKGLERLLLGSVAEAVVRESPSPVLVVRGKVREFRSILAPVNFTSYSEYGLAYAAGVAAAFGARLTAAHVYGAVMKLPDPGAKLDAMLARLPADLRAACGPNARVLAGDSPEETLRRLRGQDLVVMVARKRDSLALLSTTAQRMLRFSNVPVLCVPAPRRPFSFARATGPGGEAVHLLPPR